MVKENKATRGLKQKMPNIENRNKLGKQYFSFKFNEI